MKNWKQVSRIILLSLAYFLLAGFLNIVLLNLVLRGLFLPFLGESLVFSLVNLFLSLVVLFFSIRYFSRILIALIKTADRKIFTYISSSLMFLASSLSCAYWLPSLLGMEKLVQVITTLFLVGFFVFLSYNYIIKSKVNI